MAFPNFEGKHAHDAMFSAKDYLAHFVENGGKLDFEMPPTVLIIYHSDLYTYLKEKSEQLMPIWQGGLYQIPDTKIGFIGGFGIGAPAAVAIFEELIALGAKKFLSIGTAGTLQKDIQIGSLLIIDKSIRDEGTSHHYLPSGQLAYATNELTEKIVKAFSAQSIPYRRGTSWTTDAPYRETVEEARHYQQEGVLCVEMELAALFAVAEVRGVEIGAIVTVSDSLAELEWKPHLRTQEMSLSLKELGEKAIEICRSF